MTGVNVPSPLINSLQFLCFLLFCLLDLATKNELLRNNIVLYGKEIWFSLGEFSSYLYQHATSIPAIVSLSTLLEIHPLFFVSKNSRPMDQHMKLRY